MSKLSSSTLSLTLAAALAAPAAWAAINTVIDPDDAPTGTHLQTGTIGCTVNNLTVTCSQFELAGVGSTNATAVLSATYTAIVNCTNRGGELVEVKSTVQSLPVIAPKLSPKNGRLSVPVLSSAPRPTDEQFEALATCPNRNWKKDVQPGGIQIASFTYALTFEGFTQPYILITGTPPF
jgi:hypothetical protein